MNTDKIRITGNSPEENPELREEIVSCLRDEAAAGYTWTSKDVDHIMTALMKEKAKEYGDATIKVPQKTALDKIWDAIAARAEAKDAAERVGEQMKVSSGQVLGRMRSKAEAIRLAQEQREAA